MSHRFETIEDRNNAEEFCDHKDMTLLCLNCGGLLARYCEICGKDSFLSEIDLAKVCECDKPEYAERA